MTQRYSLISFFECKSFGINRCDFPAWRTPISKSLQVLCNLSSLLNILNLGPDKSIEQELRPGLIIAKWLTQKGNFSPPSLKAFLLSFLISLVMSLSHRSCWEFRFTLPVDANAVELGLGRHP
jgi:hypothetical protein